MRCHHMLAITPYVCAPTASVSKTMKYTQLPLLNVAFPHEKPSNIHFPYTDEDPLLDQDQNLSSPLPSSSIYVPASPLIPWHNVPSDLEDELAFVIAVVA
ncbi:hypothetical protein VNO78_00305 [Psophocarpus tetragonolobus]|uniref:Uncharacterized protein n=1 Tax=Psophocarpus tetragonolobus TaxID=3891 RepID=A0AAN9SX03_PSOTE